MVAMSGLMPTPVMSSALMRPTTAPTSSAARIATQAGNPASSRLAAVVPALAITAATDRSTPPPASTSVEMAAQIPV
jgi:hypothetical protein